MIVIATLEMVFSRLATEDKNSVLIAIPCATFNLLEGVPPTVIFFRKLVEEKINLNKYLRAPVKELACFVFFP